MKLILSAAILSCSLLLNGCSKSPKEEALAGFYDGCYIAKNKKLKTVCDCAIKKIDNEFNDKFFEGDADYRKFETLRRRALELVEQCKQ